MDSKTRPDRNSRVAAAALALVILAGCAPRPPYELSKDDRDRFGKDVLIIPPAKSGGAPLIFGLNDCTLYKAVTENGQIKNWKITLRSDWGSGYLKFMTVCQRESMKRNGKYVEVSLCAQAIGAGGGCAGGGEYRSPDGEHNWEIGRTGVGWVRL